jgi:DNA-binding LytR/AlgR family response regulator
MKKALIIEDEKLAAERLYDMLNEIDNNIDVVAELTNIKDSIKWLQNNKADIIFLDIKLEDGSSFEIFNEVKVETPIIFTTAYDKYAIDAFKLNSIDYLLKPFSKESLKNSLDKLEKISFSPNTDLNKLLEMMKPNKEYKKSFLVNIGSKILKIDCKDISYFFADNKMVFCKLNSKKEYPIDYSLDNLEKQLDPKMFYRINRKILLSEKAISSIYAYSRGRLKLEVEPPLPNNIEALVSIEKTQDFKDWLT